MISVDAPYSDDIAAFIRSTAPVDFPVGDLKTDHAEGRVHFAVKRDGETLLAVVAYRIDGETLEIIGLNAEAAPFALRSLWETLEAYALGHTEVTRVLCMVELRKMQEVVARFGMKPRAVMYVKAV